MSVFDRLAPLIPQASASCRQTKEHPKVCVSPPLSLSSPVIKKKAIQIPSFDEKGLIFEKHNTNLSAADRSFYSVCSLGTSSQKPWSKSCPQRNHGERASTLPRTKPKTCSPQSLSGKPSISIIPALKPNSSPTLPILKPRPSDFLHLPASQLSDPPPSLHQPKPSISPTLIVPTPRLSPSPTSMCQGMSSDGQGGKQPSPVAKERRARSIPISNPKAEPLNEAKHDILDQDALLDFTHPEVRKVRPVLSREFPHRTYSESCRLPATSQNPCLLQRRFGISKGENIANDKPKTPPRNIDITAVPKPKSNIKQQQESEPSRATGTRTSASGGMKSADMVHRESDGLASQLSVHRKCADYNQKSNYTQKASDFTSSHRSYEQMCSEKRAALPATSKMPFSTEPLLSSSAVSPSIETRRRRFDLHNDTRIKTASPPGPDPRRPQEENKVQTIAGNLFKACQQAGAHQNISSPQKYRFSSKTQSQTVQMDVRSAVSQFDWVSKDYGCQSGDIDQKMEASRRVHRLNRLRTCLVAPQTQEASSPASVERITSHTGSFSNPEHRSHEHHSNQDQSLVQTKKSRQVKVSDTDLKQTDIFAPPDHHVVPTKLPEHPSEKYVASWTPSVALCPLNTNRSGISSTGAFDLLSQPQHRVNQRTEETTTTKTAAASLPTDQLNHSVADRAFITEESDDPYYVTMYYPGSVYVGEYRET